MFVLKKLFFLLWFTIELCLVQNFNINEINVNVKHINHGFRISVSDEPGIKFVAFNVNINRKFKNFEAGQYSGSTNQYNPNIKEWIFDVVRKLNDKDVVYIWIGVQHENLIYRTIIKPFYVQHNVITQVPTTETPTITTITTTVPITIIQRPIGNSNNGANGKSHNQQECETSITVLPDKKKLCKNELIFEENFDVLLLNTWYSEIRLPLEIDDSEFVIYNNSFAVENGHLIINAKLYEYDDIYSSNFNLGLRCTGKIYEKECSTMGRFLHIIPPIISGRLNTKESFYFKYGRVEIRAKLPLGDWLFPLLLLEPKHHAYNNEHYDSGQMRIAFSRGNRNLNWIDTDIGASRLFGGGVFSENIELRHRNMVSVTMHTINPRQNFFANDFHVYSLTWTPEYLQLAVDGHEYGYVDTNFKVIYKKPLWERGKKNAPLDKFFYITLGLAVGGHGDFPDAVGDKPWENKSPRAIPKFWEQREEWHATWSQPSLEIDYVRVYAI